MGKIKSRKSDGQPHIIKDNTSLRSPIPSEHPVFCLKYIVKDYCLSSCNKDEQAALSNTLHKLSKLSWTEIRSSHRHGCGCEKIPRDALAKTFLHGVSEDIDFFLAFRFSGKKSMIGYKDQQGVFRIRGLDRNFTAYKHN